MIGILFNRFSYAVIAAEAAGTVLFAAGAARIVLTGGGLISFALIVACAVMFAFIRYCTSVRWYRGVPKYSGIELQFKKAMVPASYALLVCGAWLLALPSAVPIAVLAFVLLVVAHVNVILIYLHRRDRDVTPVNFYSSGAFLKKG